MRKGFGIICLLLGVLCLLGAIGLVVYNRWEAENAQVISQDLLADVQTLIEDHQTPAPSDPMPQPDVTLPVLPELETVPAEMATVRVDGYDCIGILSIPVLELKLPVLADWSYSKLQKAPCHYYGTYYETDFVIAAHNYDSHFGRLSQLQPGDLVLFTDVSGKDHFYEVVLTETLPPQATQEMICSGFGLSLYTCTPGGGSRVTVRCNPLTIQ